MDGDSTVRADRLTFRKGVIGEDLDKCPGCSWDDDYITEYCAPCADSVDLIIEFLGGEIAKARAKK